MTQPPMAPAGSPRETSSGTSRFMGQRRPVAKVPQGKAMALTLYQHRVEELKADIIKLTDQDVKGTLRLLRLWLDT